jgi:hypothetical protein
MGPSGHREAQAYQEGGAETRKMQTLSRNPETHT